jgi:pimeloyl-ACP methyl ester carboxylesterase
VTIIQRGAGRPIVLVPGLQGRYEWQLPTVNALATLGQVSTFSLCDEPTSGFACTEAAGFENYLTQVSDVLRDTGVTQPLLVGISYGGLVAAEYAARHPGALSGLVIASAPPPGWTLPARAQRYLRAPRLMTPAFVLGAPFRLYPECRAAFPDVGDFWRFVTQQGRRVLSAPPSTPRMARRLRWLTAGQFSTFRPIPVPALIVVGEAALERVVPTLDTLRYRAWLPHAQIATLAHTGHSGTVTRAGDFARLVADFITSRSVRADRVS